MLPEIVGVEAVRRGYERPRVYYADRQRREAREAVEIMVRTSEELPIADVSPVLFVGEVPLISYEGAGPHLYRFFAFEFEKLRVGDAISLGWPDSPGQKVRSNFRYQVRGGAPVA
ncbi:MAG: hypothetical protein M3461_11890 [Pseudomonadota bacterium]|nr:hypothetical protein [Pseudomonadota bacterium]